MFIKIFLIVTLLEFSLSEYDAIELPMSKDSKYGDDVCSYYDDRQKYVKPCEKGKFCDISNKIDTLDYSRGKYYVTEDLEICQDLPKISTPYIYNEEGCKNDFECEGGFKCIDSVCSVKCDSGKFLPYNGVSENDCIDNSFKVSDDGICEENKKDDNDGHDNLKIPTKPKPYKKCGKITSFLDHPLNTHKGIYYINKKEYVYKGEVEDGEYVSDKDLCKSGFALYFYKDGKTEDPKDKNISPTNSMNLRCVTPISINTDYYYDSEANSETISYCSINYKLEGNDEELRYNLQSLSSLTSLQANELLDYCKNDNRLYIKLISEKYREFYSKITEEERKTCEDLDGKNKYTCENNELIKIWYFHKNPKKYTTYNNRKKLEKVIDYHIQRKYPCYSFSQFLNIKFIYLLFLFLF